ncbi:ABC transporter ATP-binding protein/permease [Ectothiorhodospiraceae bacterium BW-2]|nr:ABC transporter ATP-binding protein/permease [Ectothiorhodospiraceae bacterium BW-2]
MRTFHTEPPREDCRDLDTLKSLLPYLWDYRGRAGLALLFLVLSKTAIVGVPLMMKEIVDYLDSDTVAELALPISLLVAYGVLRLAGSLFNELRDVVFARVRHGTMKQLSLRALDQLHRLSLRYHLERKTGALARDMERGARSAASLLNFMLFNIIPTLVELLLVALIMLQQYTPWFAIITLAIVVVYILTTFKITAWRMQFRHKMNALDSEANSIAIDSLINYETVKYFNNEIYENRRYRQTLTQWEDAAVMSQTTMSGLNIAQGALIALGVSMIMVLAAEGVINGDMSMGDLVLVNALMLQVFIPLNFLGVVYSQVKHALSDMAQMFELMQKIPDIVDAPDATELEVGRGEIIFNRVSFHYQPERPILKQISLRVEPGKKVAVVGHSGSGKSTLARLLYRFYDIQQGEITINGTDIRRVTQESLRRVIGIVPQDTVLFNDTIAYNIGYANPEAEREAIIAAAKAADIDNFITSLPDGYETMVGERGLKLSGGEKQRIAIARAILKRPQILIFDEATSSLDSRSEQSILHSLRQLASHHATLVIAHRLSTIVDADEILVMSQGEIIERGSHAELLGYHGHYAGLWQLQRQQAEKS